jgi:hypothetical protein
MNTLQSYLETIVDPTWDDFHENRSSVRHAFLACVAIFHSVDRVAEETSNAAQRNLYSVIRDAVRFVHRKAGTEHPALPGPSPPPPRPGA